MNESCAKTLWPGEDPIGKIVAEDVDRTAVGVVGDVRHMALEEKSGNEFYIPIRQTELVRRLDLPGRWWRRGWRLRCCKSDFDGSADILGDDCSAGGGCGAGGVFAALRAARIEPVILLRSE